MRMIQFFDGALELSFHMELDGRDTLKVMVSAKAADYGGRVADMILWGLPIYEFPEGKIIEVSNAMASAVGFVAKPLDLDEPTSTAMAEWCCALDARLLELC